MNNQYFTRNIHVSSLIGDFKLFHDYIFDCDLFKKDKNCRFDIINMSNDDKIKMLADCTYELTIFKDKLNTTKESFEYAESESDFKAMYINILEAINVLKPYVLESDLLHEMQIKSYFTRAVYECEPLPIKPKSEDEEILKLLRYFYNKDKEYETKASFYTAAENKPKVKDYTKETWFIVGLKFVDGTVYECEKIHPDGTKLVELVFKNEFVGLGKEEKSTLISRYRNPINGSLNKGGFEDRNLFKNEPKFEDQWRLICNYYKEQGGKIDNRFVQHFMKIYNLPIE